MCRLQCVAGLDQNLTHAARRDAGELSDLLRTDALILQGQQEPTTHGVGVPVGRDPKQALKCLLEGAEQLRQHVLDIGVSATAGLFLQPWLIRVQVVEAQTA